MTRNYPGYPLPDGELGEDDIVCQLVYLPDRDEYWQALLAAVHYMSTWIAWERDEGHRGKDAASNWREAFELTMGCWRMTCLDEITDRMDIMIDLLGAQVACCDSMTIGPVITVITNITPGVGDDPEFWGETAVEDWEEWTEYVCYHAHRYVDSLIESAKVLDLAVTLGNYTIELLALMQQTLWYILEGTPVGAGQIMEIYQNFREGVDLVSEFDGLADKFEAAREDIVCSIIQGGSLSDAVEDAIDNNIVWLLFYVFTDYGGVQAVIYEGTVDGTEYLPPVKRDDCDTCGYIQEDGTTVSVDKIWGESISYDSEEKEWTIPSWGVGGCEQSSFIIWETPAKLARKPCIVVITSCTGVAKCSTLAMQRGIKNTITQYEDDHPPLTDITSAQVDEYRHLHVAVIEYDLKFKLYNIA